METSRFLGKVLGLYLVVGGLALLVNQGNLSAVVEDFAQSPALVVFSGAITLAIGLMIVVSHNVWSASWTVIVTVFGWLFILGGVARMLRPDMVAQFALPSGAPVIVYGVVVIALGGLLSYKGFST